VRDNSCKFEMNNTPLRCHRPQEDIKISSFPNDGTVRDCLLVFVRKTSILSCRYLLAIFLSQLPTLKSRTGLSLILEAFASRIQPTSMQVPKIESLDDVCLTRLGSDVCPVAVAIAMKKCWFRDNASSLSARRV
jgi:hypothetical protein